MNLSFIPLNRSHFPLLLKWLETPYVKAWWDRDVKWTETLIQEKYDAYVEGYKVLKIADQIIKKPIHAFIIIYDSLPIGYIQYYSKHNFPSHHGYESRDLPKLCAGLDWYIGELEFTGRGIGQKVLEKFIHMHVLLNFEYVFVDPEIHNTRAISVYTKVGFKQIKRVAGVIWMLLEKRC